MKTLLHEGEELFRALLQPVRDGPQQPPEEGERLAKDVGRVCGAKIASSSASAATRR